MGGTLKTKINYSRYLDKSPRGDIAWFCNYQYSVGRWEFVPCNLSSVMAYQYQFIEFMYHWSLLSFVVYNKLALERKKSCRVLHG